MNDTQLTILRNQLTHREKWSLVRFHTLRNRLLRDCDATVVGSLVALFSSVASFVAIRQTYVARYFYLFPVVSVVLNADIARRWYNRAPSIARTDEHFLLADDYRAVLVRVDDLTANNNGKQNEPDSWTRIKIDKRRLDERYDILS